MPQSAEAMPTKPAFEGTWDELMAHNQDFAGKKLRLTIIADEEEPEPSQLARIAAVDAVYGKYVGLGVSVDELHRGRQADKQRDTQAGGRAGK